MQTKLHAADAINAVRNDTKGHGVTEDEGVYRALYDENVGHLEALLELALPLVALRLVKPAAQTSRRGGVGSVAVRVLVGSHPVFATEQIETREAPDTDCLVYDPQTGTFTSLYPWLLFDPCDECHREMVSFYDKVDDRAAHVREFVTNHTTKRTELRRDVQAAFDALAGARR